MYKILNNIAYQQICNAHTHITSKSPELSFNQNDKAMNENGEAFSFAIARTDGNDHLLISVYSRLLCFPEKVLSNYYSSLYYQPFIDHYHKSGRVLSHSQISLMNCSYLIFIAIVTWLLQPAQSHTVGNEWSNIQTQISTFHNSLLSLFCRIIQKIFTGNR